MNDFPGSDFPSNADKNLAALKYLDDMFAYQRIKPIGWIKYICLLLYYPFGWLLAFFRLVLFVPLSGIIASINCLPFCLSRGCHTIILRLELLVFFGVWIEVKGKPDHEAKVWVANHISEFDAPCLRALADPYIVGYSFYTTMWFLKCSPLSIMKMLYVDPRSRTEGNATARDEINDKIRGIVIDKKELFLIFPEGGLTNKPVGLMQYHKYVFGLGVKVQPIALRIASPLPIYTDSAYASFFGNLLYFFLVPFQKYVVEFLPVSSINESKNESSLDFARRVTALTAKALDMKVSPFLYSDKKKWLSLKKSLINERFQPNFTVDEQAKKVLVTNCFKETSSRNGGASCKSNSAAVIVPSQSQTPRELLLDRMRDVWGMDNVDFAHLAFASLGDIAITAVPVSHDECDKNNANKNTNNNSSVEANGNNDKNGTEVVWQQGSLGTAAYTSTEGNSLV